MQGENSILSKLNFELRNICSRFLYCLQSKNLKQTIQSTLKSHISGSFGKTTEMELGT